jgi:Tol biopolymer transport system component
MVIVFQSSANNLDANDTGSILDVYVHFVETGETRLVSANLDGVSSGAQALSTRISADGNWVVFSSGGNLTGDPNDTGNNIYLHHLPTGTTTRVDRSSPDEDGNVVFSNGNSGTPMVSGDGRYIVWEEFGANLVPGDTTASDIFLHDRLTGLTTRASQNAAGEGGASTPANASTSLAPAISDDGGTIVFSSIATNLLLPTIDANGNARDIFAVSNLPDVVSLLLQEDPLTFVYSEDGFVIDGVSANAGFGGTPDLGTVPLSLMLLGSAGAQMWINGDDGIGMRSPGENPGLVGQTFSRTEGLRIWIDDDARFDFAYSAEIELGRVVAPGNKGAVKVVSYLDDQFVFEQTIAVSNGNDQTVTFDPDGNLAFDRIEIYAADGNAIQFSVSGVQFELLPDYQLL